MDLIQLSIYYKNMCISYILYNECFNTNYNYNYNNGISSEIMER